MGVKGTKKAIRNLKETYDGIQKGILKDLTKNSILLASHTKERYLQGGTTFTRLRKRTGKLQTSTRPLRAKRITEGGKAGITFGTVYAKVHIGKRGDVTTIRPKNKKYLAIPLPAAMTQRGVLRASPRDESVFGKTFVARSKAGNLIIFGQMKYQKGQRAGELKGKIIPLFILKKSVNVMTRVDSDELIQWVEPKLIKDVEKTVKRAVSIHKGALK